MIDAGQLTATEVAQHLLGLARDLLRFTDELNTKDIAATELAEDAKLAEARAFVAAEGPIDQRKALSIIETHEARLAARLAEAEVRGLQRSVRTLERRIDVGRSHGATVRAEVAMAGVQS